MLLFFSIITRSGEEIFSYSSETQLLPIIDSQLLIGFMTALQSYSKHTEEPIQHVQFSNMMLYIRSFESFGLYLLFEEKLEETQVHRYFEHLEEDMKIILDSLISGQYPDKKEIEEKLKPILSPLFSDPLVGTELAPGSESLVTARIAFTGLGNAGKTALINIFFEKWTQEMAKNVKPTIGVGVFTKFLDFLQRRVVIYDLGGQAFYQKSFTKNIQKWRDLSILIFVVDIQDSSSFKSAKRYLSDIWKTVNEVNKKQPKLSIFFHKCDSEVQGILTENIKEAMISFEEFAKVATFHFTSINDNRGNIALVKSLYFALPDILIRRILEDKFLDYFEREVLPQYSSLIEEEKFTEKFEILKPKIHESALNHGIRCSFRMQRDWLNYLVEEYVPPPYQPLSSGSITITQQAQFLYVTIPDYEDQKIPTELIISLFDGILEGIIKTFHLEEIKRIRHEDHLITWQIQV